MLSLQQIWEFGPNKWCESIWGPCCHPEADFLNCQSCMTVNNVKWHLYPSSSPPPFHRHTLFSFSLSSISASMDKLQLTGQALGRVFNFRSGCMRHTMHLRPGVAKQHNLELKTRPKQLLGSLPLVIALPGASFSCLLYIFLYIYVCPLHLSSIFGVIFFQIFVESRNPNWRGRISTVGLLIN